MSSLSSKYPWDEGVTRAPIGFDLNNHLEVCKFLLENGAEKNTRDNLAFTSHHSAAQNGHQTAWILCGKQKFYE